MRGFRTRAVCAFGKTAGMRYDFVFTVDLRIDFFRGEVFWERVFAAAGFWGRGKEDFLIIKNEVRRKSGNAPRNVFHSRLTLNLKISQQILIEESQFVKCVEKLT